MRYTITFHEEDFERLKAHLASATTEQAAYVLCRPSISPTDTILLVREVIPVDQADVLEASGSHMKIGSRSYTRALKRANDRKECFVFVHSHPDAYEDHSPQDDGQEAKLFSTAYIRIRTPGVHASLIFTSAGLSAARVWLPDGGTAPVERVRIIGRRFRYWFSKKTHSHIPEFFDRQVRAFGEDIQALLGRLHVGIVGVGGTGSAVAEQLIRLGVGSCLIADQGLFEASNINRVYGSRVIDETIPKVKLTERLAADIGLGTRVQTIARSISFESALREFRSCDVIFACTDDEWGRSLLTKLAIYYLLPVFDMGVKIDSKDEQIRSIHGRVTALLPGTACLFCRERITSRRVRGESIRAVNPQEAEELEKDGYIPELENPAPAVIPFTSMIAANAVSELLHRLTGFLGEDRESSEVLHLIDDTRIRTNTKLPKEGCFCGDKSFWGRADVKPFLDLTWRPE